MNTILSKLQENIAVLITVIIAFIAPIHSLMIVVGVFILADTFIGVYKAIKFGVFSSRKLSGLISKMVLYQSAIILLFILEKFLLGEFIKHFTTIEYFMTKVMALTFCGIELISMKENFKVITNIDLWKQFKTILRRAKETKDDLKNF